MIHGQVTDAYDVGSIDNFDVYAFIVVDPFNPKEAIITVVAARSGIDLGFASCPFDQYNQWRTIIPDAIEDARAAIASLIR